MNVSCPECRSVFRVDPAKVPEAGVRARCHVCGAVISVERARVPDPALVTASANSAVIHSEPHAEPVGGRVSAHEEPRGAEGRVSEPRTVGTPASMSQRSAPQIAPMREPLVPAPASTSPEGTTAAPPPPPREPQGLSTARPRPVNPYLSNTPELRARRLARALVSDLVAYNPQKREQGLRDGTLRQLFRDEIRKSWDEYVEQVGANVAESTPHFQDALNDVLAGGRRVF